MERDREYRCKELEDTDEDERDAKTILSLPRQHKEVSIVRTPDSLHSSLQQQMSQEIDRLTSEKSIAETLYLTTFGQKKKLRSKLDASQSQLASVRILFSLHFN